ncbi:MAG TPA: TIGR03557 family F420-dependent LLM class oxidoreductase [Streptosporangiaceae bacterium]|jgi:G6PDH family F420-dependent oxidoreductase
MRIGYFLASEEYTPAELLAQARAAEEHGFGALWISDHYHPWNAEQGQSPFVWSVIGALSQATSLPVTTAVTCPTVRIHPAVIAQAAATSSVMLDGRFVLGVGSGEALNEHILGGPWPAGSVRLEMLEEAVEVIRLLQRGGQHSHRGRHYTVENARLWTLPERPTPIYLSAFGPKAIDLAARIADGYICVQPRGDLVARYRDAGGTGPVQGGLKVAWAYDADTALRTAHRKWPNEQLPGELPQVLPTTRHIEQAGSLVTPEMVGEAVPCGPDAARHIDALRAFADAGFDEVYVHQIGGAPEEFFAFYAEEVLPEVPGG